MARGDSGAETVPAAFADAHLPAPEQVRADFDRFAALVDPADEPGVIYHEFVLAQAPRPCAHALEVGCGTGLFARALAARAARVTAIDFSPEMIRRAREQSSGVANLEFVEADLRQWPLPPDTYDFIVSIATLHHVPAEETLRAWQDALRPGGVLAVLDVRTPRGLVERALELVAYGVSALLRLSRTGRLWMQLEARRFWNEHGRNERYLNTAEARALGARVLPGSVVRRHLLWRYSLVWTKPAEGRDS